MSNFVLSSESTIDLPYEYAKSRNIEIIFYEYEVEGKKYEDVMGRSEEALNEFYGFIDAGHIPTTSQINEYSYTEYFKKILDTGKDILHLCFGTGMTGSYQNAVNAAEELKEEYPDRKVLVIDSLCSCGGFGLYTDNVADKRDEGLGLEELYDWALNHRLEVQHFFTNPDLTYFKRTGRLSGPTATIAQVLNIVPVMHLNAEGRMISYDKYRGKKKAYQHFVDQMKLLAVDGEKYAGKCYINHARCPEDAEMIKSMIVEQLPHIKEPIVGNIGTIIASHCGPGTISFYFVGKDRD